MFELPKFYFVQSIYRIYRPRILSDIMMCFCENWMRFWGLWRNWLHSTSIVLTSGTRKLHRNSSRTPHTTHHTPHIASTYFFFSVYLISYPILIFLLAFHSQHFQLLILLLKIVEERQTSSSLKATTAKPNNCNSIIQLYHVEHHS